MRRVRQLLYLTAILVFTSTCTSGGGGGIGGCEAWSGWTKVGTTCKGRFVCFGRGQRGTYDVEERSRQCRNGIQKVRRERFSHCGC